MGEIPWKFESSRPHQIEKRIGPIDGPTLFCSNCELRVIISGGPGSECIDHIVFYKRLTQLPRNSTDDVVSST